MVGNMGGRMFQGLPDASKMQKAFRPRRLAEDAEGSTKGHVWESFVRGMMKEERAKVGKRVDVSKGTKVRPEFRHLFPKELHKGGFEIRYGDITAKKAKQKGIRVINDFFKPISVLNIC